MEIQTPTPTQTPAPDQAEASFDIVARQDRTEANLAALRGEVDEVKARVDRIGRAAARPAIGGTSIFRAVPGSTTTARTSTGGRFTRIGSAAFSTRASWLSMRPPARNALRSVRAPTLPCRLWCCSMTRPMWKRLALLRSAS